MGIEPNDGSTLVTNTTWSGPMTFNTNIWVPDSLSLTINAGAVIKFAPGFGLYVYGRLICNGNSSNYVKITAIDTTAGWEGVNFDNDYMSRLVMANNDSSLVNYTQIEYSISSGVYCRAYGKVSLSHCKINNNHGSWGAGISVWSIPIKISSCEIFNNHASIQGGGIFIASTDILSSTINENDLHGNLSDIDGGGFYFTTTNNIAFERNIVHHNQAIKGAGGALTSTSMFLTNNRICNNNASSSGGGFYLENCNAKIISNLFANNSSGDSFSGSGGGLNLTQNSAPMLVNNTIANNNSWAGGGLNFSSGCNSTLKNCIVYGNQAINFGNQVAIGSASTDPYFDHCNMQGGVNGFGGPGSGSNYNTANYTNNIDLPALFVSPSAGAGTGYDGLNANWQLQSTSPCINTGDITGVSSLLPALDLAGNPRINGMIDMGAYEYTCTAPAQPTAISGQFFPCQSTLQIYAVANVPGVTFTWTAPAGSTFTGQGSNGILLTTGTASGNLTVTPSNACGTGPTRSQFLAVNNGPPLMGSITGNASPCQGSVWVYSVSNVPGVYYTWTVPPGSTINSPQGSSSITVVFGATSGNITVTGSNTCGTGTPGSLPVTVSVFPAQPSITGNAGPCQGSSQVYSVTNIPGMTYTWAVPAGATITAGQGTSSLSVTLGTTGGTISATPSNSCGTGPAATMSVTVNAPPAAHAGNDQTIGFGASVTLNGSATGGSGSYTWHWEPASFLVNPDVQNPVTVGLTSSQLFTLTATDASSGCAGSDQVLITVTGGTLALDVTASPNPSCAGSLVQLMAIAGGGTGNYSFLWSSNPPGFNSTLQNPDAFPALPTTYIAVINDGFATASDSVTVMVNPLPVVPNAPVGPDTVDLRMITSSVYTTNPAPSGDSLIWEITPDNAGLITWLTNAATVLWNPIFLGYAQIKVKSGNNCGESQWSQEKITFVDNTTGISRTQPVMDIDVYPNPTTGDFTIDIPGTMTTAKTTDGDFTITIQGATATAKTRVTIYGLLGEIIMETSMDKRNSQVFSLAGRPAGIYNIRVESEHGTLMRKVVKLNQ
ncbi:MAG: right-handed parallel beta-helix repeat-containing protein [Bacteroidetes bacterium]|nr:right-handed parallel beta-helix repeat-containing protein [Bacteroidota bacterium]